MVIRNENIRSEIRSDKQTWLKLPCLIEKVMCGTSFMSPRSNYNSASHNNSIHHAQRNNRTHAEMCNTCVYWISLV